MAKDPSKNAGAHGNTKGPCTDCRSTKGPFTAIRRFSGKGRASTVRLCEKCQVRT